MDQIMAHLNGDKKQLLLYGTYASAFFCFPFTICCFAVAGTANAGFNAVLTAVLNLAFVGESYYVIKNSKTPIAIGFLIGSSVMITILNFMTAIYWGQLSKCESTDVNVSQYTCTSPSAYGALCAFAVFLFLVQLAFSAGLILWRGELISEVGLYDDLPTSSSHEPSPYEQKQQSYKHQSPSADL